MPIQEFTAEEESMLVQGAMPLITVPGFVSQRINMTKAEMKAADVAMIDQKIALIEAAISNLDAKYTTLKAVENSTLTGQLAFLQGIKTKIQNLPE